MGKKTDCRTEYEREVHDLLNPYEVWMERNEKKNDTNCPATFRILYIEELSGLTGFGDYSEDIALFISKEGKLSENATSVIYSSMEKAGYNFCYADEDYCLEGTTLGDCKDEAVLHQAGLDMEYYNAADSGRMLPYFKPDFSPETLLSFRYTGNIFACRLDTLKEYKIELLRSEDSELVFYDLLLKLAERESFGHINEILFHNNCFYLAEELPGALEKYNFVKLAAITRRGLKAHLITDGHFSHIVYDTEKRVSVIIPSKDNPDMVRQCIASVCDKTDYPYFELILIDNGSSDDNRNVIEKLCSEYGVTYLYRPQEFNFSGMCNQAAAVAKGDFLLFLNDDIEIADSSWMRRMAGELDQDGIGSVGAKLLYPGTDIIQHCGISNAFVGPVHRLQNYSDKYSYYYGRNKLTYNYIGATAACLMVKREVFEEVGGFCEDIKVAYNDVDLCFKIYEAGYRQVVRNDVTIYHHESVSRGSDASGEKRKRLDSERELLYSKHPALSPERLLESEKNSIDPYCTGTQLWIRSSLFAPEFLRDYENRMKFSEVHRLSDDFPITPKGLIDRSMVMVSIDSYEDALEFDSITGWALLTKKDNSLYRVMITLFGADGCNYGISPFRTIREDVAKSIEVAQNVLLSGIRVRIRKGDIPAGRYRIGAVFDGIVSGRRYSMLSENYWEIK